MLAVVLCCTAGRRTPAQDFGSGARDGDGARETVRRRLFLLLQQAAGIRPLFSFQCSDAEAVAEACDSTVSAFV
jgi:hypothetical protein